MLYRFAKFYIDLLKEIFKNIVDFFSNVFNAFADIFYRNIINYFKIFVEQSKDFGFADWLMAVFVILINLTFIILIFIKLFQLLKKYIRFTSKEIEKDMLLEEISLLSQQIVETTSEKNKILALKMESFGMNPDLFGANKDEEVSESRFTKLIEVDRRYKGQMNHIIMSETDELTLKELVKTFINYSASQLKLYYNEQVISAFFAGLASSKIIILEGISGTGKTSLPYAMGNFFQKPASIISVQPSWRDRTEMIGYLNEFTKKFNETDFLSDLYESGYRDDPNLIVLDEMNLARIEYYFAEFLSIMEMPNFSDWKIDIVPSSEKSDPQKLIGGKINVPQNVWFIGTANKDDSTFTITDKVYDRATSIEMNYRAEVIDAPYTEPVSITADYLQNLFKEAKINYPISKKSLDNLDKLDKFIADNFKITFGNRIMRQIKDFVPTYVACGRDEVEALDYIVTRKILRKFEILNLPFLQNELKEILNVFDNLFGKDKFKLATKYINDLRKQI